MFCKTALSTNRIHFSFSTDNLKRNSLYFISAMTCCVFFFQSSEQINPKTLSFLIKRNGQTGTVRQWNLIQLQKFYVQKVRSNLHVNPYPHCKNLVHILLKYKTIRIFILFSFSYQDTYALFRYHLVLTCISDDAVSKCMFIFNNANTQTDRYHASIVFNLTLLIIFNIINQRRSHLITQFRSEICCALLIIETKYHFIAFSEKIEIYKSINRY